MKSYVSAAVANVVVNALLIPKYGFVGAAVATVISSYISVGVQYYYLNKQVKVAVFIKDLVKYLLLSLVMGAGIMILNNIIPDGVIETFADILIGSIVYLLLLLLTKDFMLIDILKNAKQFVKRKGIKGVRHH